MPILIWDRSIFRANGRRNGTLIAGPAPKQLLILMDVSTMSAMAMTKPVNVLIPYIVASLTRAQKRLLQWLPREGNATPPDHHTLTVLRALRSKQIDNDIAVSLVARTGQSPTTPFGTKPDSTLRDELATHPGRSSACGGSCLTQSAERKKVCTTMFPCSPRPRPAAAGRHAPRVGRFLPEDV